MTAAMDRVDGPSLAISVSTRGYLQSRGNECAFIGNQSEQRQHGILNESEQETALFAIKQNFLCKLLQLTVPR